MLETSYLSRPVPFIIFFPLTLALSLGQREYALRTGDPSPNAELVAARQEGLPLPQGAGRGEGEASPIA
jgi:hypothetical protein